MDEFVIAPKNDFVAVADAMRKTGAVSGQLSFPNGFVDAVDKIVNNGSSGSAEIGVCYGLGHYDTTDSSIEIPTPFCIGMTWGDWLNSPLNIPVVRTYQFSSYSYPNRIVNTKNGLRFTLDSIKYILSTDGTTNGTVLLTDLIQNNFYYSHYIDPCCFIAGTKVLISFNGDTKNIEDIKVGDEVVSYNVDTQLNYITKVKRVIIHENTTDIAEVICDNGTSVTMNAYHPLYTDQGWHSITNYGGYEALVVGDTVKTIDGWAKITNINRYISEPILTYNIDVVDENEDPDINTNDNYYANGIVAKNPPPSC